MRNPGRLSNPLRRASKNGHVWVYKRMGAKTGWVELMDIGIGVDLSKPPLKGPAGLDFEVGRTMPSTKKPSGCGKVSLTQPMRRVKARETYIRYSPRGTAFDYLHKGDVVQLLIVNGPQGFCFSRVHGTERMGWILANTLEPVT